MSTTKPDNSTDTETFVKEEVLTRAIEVNNALDAPITDISADRLSNASHHLIQAGGKRLRPVLSLLVAESISGEPASTIDYEAVPDAEGDEINVMNAALAIELIHTFSLIHDDMMDDDDLRRGVEAVHRAFDDEMAILSGDILFSKAFEVLHETGAPPERVTEATKMLSNTATQLCEGQAEDVSFETRNDVTPDEYLEMTAGKTGVLFGAAMAIPGILLGVSGARVASLYNYGLKVGKAFQIQDDVLDLTTPSEELGKQRGSDLVEEKKTLIALHAAQQGVDISGLVETENVDAVTEGEIDDAVDRLREVGSIEFAEEKAASMVLEAEASLVALPGGEPRRILKAAANYLIERGH